MDEIETGSDEIGTGSDETGAGGDETGSDETGTGSDETGDDEISIENNETNSVPKIQSTENPDMKEDIDKDGIKVSSRNQETIDKENKTNTESPKTMENIHTRRSERVRKQRYNIHPDDIGNDDDETDQDYIQEDENN